jgi:hypothetical protein
MPEENVTVGDVSRQAIERISGQVKSLTATMNEAARISADLQDQFRELLSYCEAQAQHSGSAVDESAYNDVAGKLRAILDGE